MAQPEHNFGNQPPVATGPPHFATSGDASTHENAALREEIGQLRTGLLEAQNAYNSLFLEIQSLRGNVSPSPSIPRLAPMSRVNGKKTDVLRAWFEMATTYLEAIKMNPNSKEAVLYLIAHFDAPLTLWFLAMKRNANGDSTGGFSTVAELRDACLQYHRGRDLEKLARDKLKNAKQTSTVINYAHYLEDVFLSLPDYAEAGKVHDFIFGLKPHIKEAVQLHEPTSFLAAVRLAQEKESAMSRPPSKPSATPMDLGVMDANTTRKSSSGNRPPLSSEEHNRLREAGGCFYCRQLGHKRNECPQRRGSN